MKPTQMLAEAILPTPGAPCTVTVRDGARINGTFDGAVLDADNNTVLVILLKSNALSGARNTAVPWHAVLAVDWDA